MPLSLPPMHETMILVIGLVGVLSTASLVAGILSWRAPKPLSSGLTNLNQRINAWWVMVVAITVAFFFGRTGMTILFALISFAALREFVTLTHSRRSDHWVLLGMFGIVIPFQYWLVWTAWYGLFVIFIPVYCFLLMPAITALHGDTERFLERIAAQQWAIMIAVYCVSHVPALLTLNVPGFEDQPEVPSFPEEFRTNETRDPIAFLHATTSQRQRRVPSAVRTPIDRTRRAPRPAVRKPSQPACRSAASRRDRCVRLTSRNVARRPAALASEQSSWRPIRA